MESATSWYMNWDFWTVAIALTALVLSQLPPVHRIFKRARLNIEPYNRIILTHTVGNPNATLYLALENVGGKDIKVNSVELEFKHQDGESFKIPAQNYFPSDNEPIVIMPPFRIKAGETWGHSVLFYKLFNRDDEKTYRLLVSNLKADIASKKVTPEDAELLVEADKINLDPIYKFYEKHNKWKAGEYTLTIIANTHPQEATISKSFRFTLYETDAKILKDYIDQYKIGLGIYYFDEEQQPRLVIPLISA